MLSPYPFFIENTLILIIHFQYNKLIIYFYNSAYTFQFYYIQGYRSLEDLTSKANLTKQQRIGLKYFDELQESIPRDEVEAIKDVVR